MLRKQQEYEYLKIKVPKEIISQIKGISDLQHLEFDEALLDCITVGIHFRNNNFHLQSRALKIRTLDNMLYQIYPFLHKNYQNSGEIVPIFDKIVPLYIILGQILYQKKGLVSKEVIEVVEIESWRIFEYAKNNFKEEYEEIKCFLRNTYRDKRIKALFHSNSVNLKNNKDTICTIHNELHPKNDNPFENDKFSGGYVSTGKYKKDDGSFGECSIEFPPIPYNSEQHEQSDEDYISSGKLRKNPKL